MAHQNLLFDSFLDIDRAHSSHYALNNIVPYDAYPTPGPQYSSISPASMNGAWDYSTPPSATGTIHRARPATAAAATANTTNFYHQPTPISDPSHIREAYRSYPSPPYTPNEQLHRSTPAYANAHGRVPPNPRIRTDADIAHSMLTPISAEMPRSMNPNATSAGGAQRVSWERSGPQQGGGGGLASGGSLHGVGAGAGEHFQWPPHSDSQFLSFDTRSWSESMASPSDASAFIASHAYTFPPEFSPPPPPPPQPPLHHSHSHSHSHSQSPPAMGRQVSPASSSSSRRGSLDGSSGGKSCSHCHATSTPLWRREPTTLKPLCNACGLYLQQRNKHRPQELIDADAAGSSSEDSDGEPGGPECSHCRTHHTSVWRRSKTGAQLCNACGVYSRLRGRDRPISLRKNKIKPRSKHTPRAE